MSLLTDYDDFLLAKGRAPLTRSAYRGDILQFLNFTDTPPQKITRKEIFEWDVALALKGHDPKTRARHHTSLKSFFGFVCEKYGIENPTTELETLRQSESDPQVLHPDELQAILQAQDEKKPLEARDGALITFLAATGVRREELFMLNCGAVRPREIRDKRDVRYVWQAQVQSVKPRGRMRIVNFGNLSKENDVVSRHFGAWFMIRVADLGGYTKAHDQPLFPASGWQDGKQKLQCTNRLAISTINNRVKQAVARTRNPLLAWVGPHTLRHFYATQCIAEGMDIKTVQHYLGHASVASTEHYVHLVEKMLAAQAVKFDPLANVRAKESLNRLPMAVIAQSAFMMFPTERA